LILLLDSAHISGAQPTEPVKVGGFETIMAKPLHSIPYGSASDKPSYRPPDEWGVYNGMTFDHSEHSRQERAATRTGSTAGQCEINKRITQVAEEINAERNPPPSEGRVAFALGKLLHEILQPGEQHDLVNSLTCGLQIERGSDAVMYFASEAVRALPGGQWDNVFSLLDQGGRP
jgi:hypothetical protein